MQEYYFLFGLALVWICFAVVQDWRTREISNWLNFSLLAFALTYKGFYALLFNRFDFFLLGVGGALFFTALAYVLYYGKAFAGGDAKLLTALGAVLPFRNTGDYLTLGIGFVFVLFLVGAVYSLIYSLVIVAKQPKKFVNFFKKELKSYNLLIWVSLAVLIFLFIVLNIFMKSGFGLIIIALFILPFLYAYARAFEKACMIKLVSPGQLTEGDWLEKDVHLSRSVISRSVHGLNSRDIDLLKKARKKVWIKEGIPFSPAFLLAFIIMVYVSLSSGAMMKVFEAFFYLG